LICERGRKPGKKREEKEEQGARIWRSEKSIHMLHGS